MGDVNTSGRGYVEVEPNEFRKGNEVITLTLKQGAGRLEVLLTQRTRDLDGR